MLSQYGLSVVRDYSKYTYWEDVLRNGFTNGVHVPKFERALDHISLRFIEHLPYIPTFF